MSPEWFMVGAAKGPQIRRAVALDRLDDTECVAGYLAGCEGKTCPASATYSFVHGWRNGMCDSGRRPIDEAQRELAADYVASRRKA